MNKGKLFLGSITHMITDTYASFIVGLIPLLTARLELSIFMVSILTAVNFVTSNLAQPAFGYFSDKYGMKYFLLSGPLLSSIFLSLVGIVPNYYLILLFLFLGNLGVAAIHPPSAAIASYFGGRRKGLANSLVSFGGSVGFSVGSLFIIFIINRLGIDFTPVAMIPGILMFLILLKLAPGDHRFRETRGRMHFLERLKKLKKARLALLGLVMLAAFCRDVIMYALLTFMPLYLTDKGVKLLNFGIITTFFILVGGIGGLFAGFYSDWIKKRVLVIQAGILTSIPLIFLIFRTPLHISIILFILTGFFAMSTLPLCMRLAQDIFPSDVSLASSMVLGASSGSAAAAVILLGKLADTIGITRTVNITLILPAAAGLLLFLFPTIKKRYGI